jgi:DNA polymerase III subunit beta
MTDVLSYLEGASKTAPTYDPEPKQEFDSVRFKIEKSVLLALLDKVALVVPTKADNLALKSFQVQVSADSLRIVGTDKFHTIVVSTKMFEPIAHGTMLLPAKILLEILRSVDDHTVDIEVVNKSIIIVVGGASWELRSLKGFQFPATPSLANAKPVKINRYEFVAGLTAVKYAVAKDSARAGLKMIDLKANKMTACDGIRFQQAEISAPDMKIPAGSIELLLKILGVSAAQNIIFADLGNDHILFRVDTTVLIITTPEINFPHAEQLFLRPALTNDQELTVSRKELTAAVKRVRLCADEDTSAVALKLSKDAIEVSTRDQVGNMSSESIAAVWGGKARTLIVHHRYLLDLLAVNDVEQCVFKLGEDTQNRKSPLLLQNQSAKMVGVVQQMLLGSLTGYKL